MWRTAGEHVYQTLPVILVPLSDLTDEGTAWDTWSQVKAFDYNQKRGLGGSAWPLWMSYEFTDPGVCDPSNPACGPIYRWGNLERGCDILGIDIGICRLENGPTGPNSKGVWSPGPTM